jgi:hypothetical protein
MLKKRMSNFKSLISGKEQRRWKPSLRDLIFLDQTFFRKESALITYASCCAFSLKKKTSRKLITPAGYRQNE